MDNGRNSPPRDTEPFPTITPVASASAGNNGRPVNSFTTTTTTTTTTSQLGRPTTTVTTQHGPRQSSRSTPPAIRPHSTSSPISARPPSSASAISARPASPSVSFNPPPQAQYNQNGVRRKPVASPARRPSVRIKRQPSTRSISSSVTESPPSSRPTSYASPTTAGPSTSRPTRHVLSDIDEDAIEANRRRSSSEPQRPAWLMAQGEALARASTAQQTPQLPSVTEETSNREGAPLGTAENPAELLAVPAQNAGVLRRLSVGARNAVRRSVASHASREREEEEELDPELVDVLDVVDPEVATLSTLTNVQNSLFIPDLGPLLNRQPTYVLSRRPSAAKRPKSIRVPTGRPPPPKPPEQEQEQEREQEKPPDTDTDVDETRPQLTQTSTISSTMTDSFYAVLPHGKSLDGWTDAEKAELNDHVRHMLHSKRSAFKRGLKGFGQYIRRPLGFFVTLYAVLITLFGAAWVLFLIGWINLGARRLYIINVIDNVLVALFAIMGDGLAPFRAWDTYNTIFVVHFWRVTRKLRKKKALPKLKNKNDLPTQTEVEAAQNSSDLDLEAQATNTKEKEDSDAAEFGEGKPDEYTVLSDKQQASLELHQRRLARSHTFYKPHETLTHHAFPISLLLTIIILCDLHSTFQIALGTCTWSISYHRRPFALTTVILCCSICSNIAAGVVIMIGDRRTRKKDVLERMFRQELTGVAIKKVEKRRVKTMEREERDGLMGSVIHEEGGGTPGRRSFDRLRGSGSGSGSGSGDVTPGRRSFDRLRGGRELRQVPTSTPGGGTPSQSEVSLRQVPSVPGVKVHLVD